MSSYRIREKLLEWINKEIEDYSKLPLDAYYQGLLVGYTRVKRKITYGWHVLDKLVREINGSAPKEVK